MATTTFNTRISLKYDTYANWMANDPQLLKGEVAVVVVPAETGAVAKEPSVLFKVGDGSSKFSQLQFSAGIAADVYDWAKAAQKPTYAANEITGLSDYISGQIQDTDTQYKIEVDTDNERKFHLYSQAKGASAWSLVSTIEVPAETVYTLAEGTANGTVKFNGVDIPVHGLGSAAYADTTAFEAKGAKDADIAAAKQAGDDAQAAVDALAGRVTTVEGKVGTLVGEDVNKSARAIASEEVAKIVAGAGESYDTLKEISDWISNHGSDAAAMNSAIAALQTIVDGIGGEGEKATVVDYVADAIAALKIGDYAKAADLTALAARVAALEGKAHEHGNKAVIDGITAEKVSDWDSKASGDHKHDITELNQASGYIVFNCGSSSENI